MMTIAEVAFNATPQLNTPVGPKGFPVLGSFLDIKKDALNFFVNLSQQYGDVVPYWIGPEKVFLINDPECIRYVLTVNQRNYGKSKFFRKLKPLTGGSMVMSDGEKWLKLRRTALPAMQGAALPRMADQIVDAVDDAVGRLRGHANQGSPTDIALDMKRLALDIIFRTLFRTNLDLEVDRVYDALTSALGEIERRIWSVTPIAEYLPTKRRSEFHRSIAVLEDVIREVVRARRADPEDYGDLLSIWVRATDDPDNATFTEKQLRDECMNFLMVGHDTIAGHLIWTLLLLAQHPAVERRLRQELDGVLAGRPPTYADIERLPYMRMVLDESMRLFPPGWTFSRTALTDDRIGGVDIPKGSSIQICPYAMHRNPRYWENPEAFDPERFLPERSYGRPQFAYFPFGGGGRICIGRKIAMMEGMLVVSRLLQSFRLGLVPGQKIEIEPMITLQPKAGIKMTLSHAPDVHAGDPESDIALPPELEASMPVPESTPASGCPFAAGR